MVPQPASAAPPAMHPAVAVESTVHLFPVAITRTHFKFRVVGLGSTRSVFLTADETVALRFLLKDKVLSKATARLHAFNAGTGISYVDLVSRLLDAGLVHRIDDRQVEAPYARWTQLAAARVSHLVRAVPSEAARLFETAGSRVLPLRWMLAVNRAVVALSIRRRRRRIVDRLKHNMARILVRRAGRAVERSRGPVRRRVRSDARGTGAAPGGAGRSHLPLDPPDDDAL